MNSFAANIFCNAFVYLTQPFPSRISGLLDIDYELFSTLAFDTGRLTGKLFSRSAKIIHFNGKKRILKQIYSHIIS